MKRRQSKISTRSDTDMDSWDAFDAKMKKTKRPVKKDVHNQFLELSSTQNKSLNIANEDFSALSFQDAKDLIDKDENERLQFLNSNVSFSDGIEQVEAPSLLSVTNYFQQGSSFPVPFTGNDSTMFGDSHSLLLPHASPHDTSLFKNRSSSSTASRSMLRSSKGTKADLISDQVTSQGTSKSNELSRSDSLSKFFLGPQSDGLNKVDIMDYVLDYCKRRASIRLSDASDVATSPSNSSNSKNSTPERHDSGIGIGGEEKTKGSSNCNKNNLSSRKDVKDNIRSEKRDVRENAGVDKRDVKESSRSSKKESRESTRVDKTDVKETARLDKRDVKENSCPEKKVTKENGSVLEDYSVDVIDGRQFTKGTKKMVTSLNDNDESVLIVNGASIKDDEMLGDVFDVGSIDGFEKFKKNLHARRKHLDDRYRRKVRHHEDFEKKRLNVDERFSHPRLSPLAFKGPGATTSMERPHKKLPCKGDSPVLKQSDNIPHENLSVVPVVHSSVQPQQQQLAGNHQVCSCTHQCGQQSVTHGLMPNGGLPIVIHIHLPYTTPTSGTVVHPVPTTSSENSKKN